MFETEKVKQLKIYFLFMLADGNPSNEEMKYLNGIIAKMDLSTSGRQEFQAFCGQFLMNTTNGESFSAIQEIDRMLGKKTKSFFGSMYCLDDNQVVQAQTIWTLINLGYADNEYSQPEKEVINYLVERWELDPILVSELKDTADTILALTLQKEWIQNTEKSYKDVSSIVQEIDRNIATMFENVEIVIAEAAI